MTGRPVFAGLSHITTMLAKGAGAEVPLPAEVKRSAYGALIQHATEVDPARRFANASEMLGALAVVNPADVAAARFWRWVAAGVAVAGLASAIAFGAVMARSGEKGDDASSRRDEDDEEEKDRKSREPKDKKVGEQPSAHGVQPSPSGSGTRERLGPRTVLYSGPLEIDRAGLVERVRKAGFNVEEADNYSMKTKRGGAMCIAVLFPGPGKREECVRVSEEA